MSLRRLRLSLERLIPRENADPSRIADLESLFLTSRQCSEKYQRLIPEFLNTVNPDEPAEFEQTMIWFAFKNDKLPDESVFGGNEEEREEKWKADWLDRMERRESVYPLRLPRVPLTAFKGTDSNHLTPVPGVSYRTPSHWSVCRRHPCLSQETKTAQSTTDPLARG